MASDKPLERYIRILEVISGYPDGIGLTPVAEILGLPKTSVHRLINGLVATALIEPVETGATAYRLGPRFATLFYSGAGEDWISAVGQPLLKDLATETGQACFIAKLTGGVVRSVGLVSPDTLVRPHVLPGREIPLHTGASAKAILAFLDPAIALALLPRPLIRLTGQTQTDPKLIMLEWAAIRDSGVALCVGEDVAGFAGIAVPIAVSGQTVRYSLCLSGTIEDLINANRDRYAELLQGFAAKLAKSIAARLPGRPATD